MTRGTVALLLGFLVLGASTPLPTTTVQPAAAPVAIPFELSNRHVIVKVSVNRSRPLSFVLDTGANAAIIRMNVAKELRLTLHGRVDARGAGSGSQAGSRVDDARWSLVGLERFTQTVALALPLPDLPSALGRDVDGIVGGEFIRQFVVELDYQARLIRLHDGFDLYLQRSRRGTAARLQLERPSSREGDRHAGCRDGSRRTIPPGHRVWPRARAAQPVS